MVKMKALDLYDKKILYELDINSRIPISTLGKKVKLSKETVNYRLNKLIENKYIRSFYTTINASLLGFRYHLIFFKLHDAGQADEEKIQEYLKAEESCFSVRVTEGNYDIQFITTHKSISELHEFINGFMKMFGRYIAKKTLHRLISINKLNSKLFYKGPSIKRYINLADNKNEKLDHLDMEILKILSANSREKLVELAKRTKTEKSKTLYRKKRLEKKGLIVSYNLAYNLDKIKYFPILLCLSLKNTSFIPSIIEYFDEEGLCMNAYNLIGEYDLMVEMHVEDPVKLRLLIKDFKTRFQKHLIDTSLLTVYKDFPLNWFPHRAGLRKL